MGQDKVPTKRVFDFDMDKKVLLRRRCRRSLPSDGGLHECRCPLSLSVAMTQGQRASSLSGLSLPTMLCALLPQRLL